MSLAIETLENLVQTRDSEIKEKHKQVQSAMDLLEAGQVSFRTTESQNALRLKAMKHEINTVSMQTEELATRVSTFDSSNQDIRNELQASTTAIFAAVAAKSEPSHTPVEMDYVEAQRISEEVARREFLKLEVQMLERFESLTKDVQEIRQGDCKASEDVPILPVAHASNDITGAGLAGQPNILKLWQKEIGSASQRIETLEAFVKRIEEDSSNEQKDWAVKLEKNTQSIEDLTAQNAELQTMVVDASEVGCFFELFRPAYNIFSFHYRF